MSEFKNPVCKGSIEFGSACGLCERCKRWAGIDYAHGKDKTVKTEYVLKSKYAALQSQNAELIAALEYYADRNNSQGPETVPCFVVEYPAGSRAREVLRKVKGDICE